MMMRMLAAGGLPPLTDGERGADEDNPHGYFELESVKRLADDNSWVARAEGKAVKVVSALLEHLPPLPGRYRTVFMLRDIDEVLASQRAMLIRRGQQLRIESEEWTRLSEGVALIMTTA
jgi:hypothetical protein